MVAKNLRGGTFFRWNDLNLSGDFLKTIFSKDGILVIYDNMVFSRISNTLVIHSHGHKF